MSSSDQIPRASTLGVVTIVLTLVGWSSIPLFLKHFADHIDGWTSNGWRYGFSALLWLPVVVIGVSRGRLRREVFIAAIIPSVINAIGQVTFTWAHYKIDPGLLTFGLRSQMVFVAIGAYMLFPVERAIIRRPGYLIGLGLLGVGTIGTIGFGQNPFVGAHVFGVGLAVASGFLFAAYGLAVRKYMHGTNSVVAFAVISQYTAAAMIVMMLLLGDRGGLTAIDLGTGQFSLLLLSAIIGIALGHVLYYVSIARLGVAVSAGVLQLHPFLVAVGSMLLFGEHLTPLQWAAGSIALLGAIVMVGVQRRVKPTPAPRAVTPSESPDP